MGEMTLNATRYFHALDLLSDIRRVEDRENTTTDLWRQSAMSTMIPTSSPAMNAAASARPSKNEWMDSPAKADIEVMLWECSSSACSSA